MTDLTIFCLIWFVPAFLGLISFTVCLLFEKELTIRTFLSAIIKSIIMGPLGAAIFFMTFILGINALCGYLEKDSSLED